MRGLLRIAAPDLQGRRPLIDLGRLVRGRTRRFGTGVDRIDLALARALIDAHGPTCRFVVEGALGPAILPEGFGPRFVAALERRWGGEETSVPALPALATAQLRALIARAVRDAGAAVYVNASHSGLPRRPGFLARLDPERKMERLIYVHDLIPLDYPEYQRPGAGERFERFLTEAASGPVRFLANTLDTARRISRHAADRGWPRCEVATLIPTAAPEPGPVRPSVARVLAEPRPLFLCVGTIEARKNHLLLLTLWRELAAEGRAPRLVLCGRRGWESEMVFDLLERCAAIAPHVAEFGDLDDGEVAALMRGARALLFPSFAEGLGIPLLEAAALGLPAIVSDLPALREIAPPGTVFLHPLDGLGWRRAILDAAGQADVRAPG